MYSLLIGDAQIKSGTAGDASVTQAPVPPHDSDPSVSGSTFTYLCQYSSSNLDCTPCFCESDVKVPIDVAVIVHPLANNVKEAGPSNRLFHRPFYLGLSDSVIIDDLLIFLRGIREYYNRTQPHGMLKAVLDPMLDVPDAVDYLQKNKYEGPPLFVWLLGMAENILNPLDPASREVRTDTVSERIVKDLTPHCPSGPVISAQLKLSCTKILWSDVSWSISFHCLGLIKIFAL